MMLIGITGIAAPASIYNGEFHETAWIRIPMSGNPIRLAEPHEASTTPVADKIIDTIEDKIQ